MGRKPMFIISAVGCAIALLGEGIFFYLKDHEHENVSSLSWLPPTGLIVFALLNNFGLFTLPYVLIGELFATNIKEIASSLTILYGGVLAFLVTKFFDPISEAWGRFTMFWIFAGCCAVGAVFIFFALPETKGKTFTEIQEKLNRNRKQKKDKKLKTQQAEVAWGVLSIK